MDDCLIKIRPLGEEDLKKSNWLYWLSDYETTKYQNLGYFPQNYSRQISYINSKLTSNEDVLFAIEVQKNDKSFVHIGNVGLHSIDFIHRRCLLGIIIGEKDYRGKGVGRFSWEFITNHAFKMLNLHKVYAYIFEENINSRKCAEKSGYIEEAKLLDYYYRNGKYQNCIIYSKTNNLVKLL
mgnify:FL=1